MMKYWPIYLMLFLVPACSSQTPTEGPDIPATKSTDSQWNQMAAQYNHLIRQSESYAVFPYSYSSESGVESVPAHHWVSGFFPGTLWKLYQLNPDPAIRTHAEGWTREMYGQAGNVGTHDLGFMVLNSVGEAYRVDSSDLHRKVILEAARSLAARFSERVGMIRSWDWGEWQFPVIIDNMMNLQLLYTASEISGETMYRDIATLHARKTAQSHFRGDYSSFHVVDFDPISGEILKRQTWQGASDSSAWARGQAWGLYGFTQCYLATGDSLFLDVAMRISQFLLQHPNMPTDGVPYWDLDAPGIPHAPRDVSAAAVMASAWYDLAEIVDHSQGDEFRTQADLILEHLQKPPYWVGDHALGGFLLTESVASIPQGHQVSQPLNYADYYFLEALIKQRTYQKSRSHESESGLSSVTTGIH
ncbi:glycoside hydrolase family 88 protein [Pontibacter sp. G13]|uniref:glycoside hydrolase family 88 protein n=1 Tax=Pontibacter sp. G13 TaxID=3074898 RepID=UPI00288A09AE|nr:glycoside hydrolase family 88 protein [Pontibacter sp. G13]WNJ20799.1 glycoside hydrolase family 88 protein [Pontibacter sp. G13]